MLNKLWNSYFENYKKLIIIPITLIILMSGSLITNKLIYGEFVSKDVSLKGGYQARITTNTPLNLTSLNDVEITVITNPITGELKGYDLVSEKEITSQQLSEILNVNEEDVSVGYKSATIAQNFYHQSIIAILIAFALMGGVVYYYFRQVGPTISITLSTLFDVIGLLGLMNVLGLKLSSASIGALLMIIGYSTDSDVLLSTNIFKRKDDSLKSRMLRAFKAEITMDSAALIVFATMYLLTINKIIKDIAIILFFGIIFDLINTWLGTAAVQRMLLKKEK